jgi:anti-anti-sigma factor
MKHTQCGRTKPRAMATNEFCDLSELVKGSDERLLAQMMPLVHRENMSLNLKSVERIDAAGVAALIQLYRGASESGHSFTVANASPHVAEILKLVGLDRILLSHNMNRKSHSELRLRRVTA